MKRLIIAILFLVISFALSLYSLSETVKKCDTLTNSIENVIKTKNENEENYEKIKYTVSKVNEEWETSDDIFNIFFNNSDFKGIELNIKKMKIHIENGDTDAVYLCASEALEEICYLKNSVFPTINNIF